MARRSSPSTIVDTIDEPETGGTGGGSGLWPPDDKRRMIEDCRAPGASVVEVALRHVVNANLLFTWKRRRRATGKAKRAPWLN
jgi:transposase-like protein